MFDGASSSGFIYTDISSRSINQTHANTQYPPLSPRPSVLLMQVQAAASEQANDRSKIDDLLPVLSVRQEPHLFYRSIHDATPKARERLVTRDAGAISRSFELRHRACFAALFVVSLLCLLRTLLLSEGPHTLHYCCCLSRSLGLYPTQPCLSVFYTCYHCL